jgi:predicted ABC-type ATPase
MTLRHTYINPLFIAIALNIHRLHLEKIKMKIKHGGLFLEELKFQENYQTVCSF